MADLVATWLLAVLLTLPVAVVVERRARRAGVSPGRRWLAFGLALLAAPLGVGLWIGLLHRQRA